MGGILSRNFSTFHVKKPEPRAEKHFMDDDEIIRFLMSMSGIVARLHLQSRVNGPVGSNRGPDWGKDWREAFEEGFARWMGFRGEEEQERELREFETRRRKRES